MKPRTIILERRVAIERKWIAEHGGNLAGYVLRYGSAHDVDRYGDGGEAIYEADLAALNRALAHLVRSQA